MRSSCNDAKALISRVHLIRYADLVEEWRNGQPVDACETKSWEASYTALHADMLSQARAPSLLEYRCRLGEHCGGFADRCVLVAPVYCHTIGSRS